MENDEDNHSQVKQAVDEEYSEEAAEQPSIKINAQGLEADIRVREQEDLETVIANLEFLARRNNFDTDLLGNRSVDREDDQVEQLNEVLTTVAENVQELNERVDRVEDELGGGEDSQLAEVIDRIQELEDSVHDLPEDVSRHLGELREQVTALEEYIEDVDEYATSVDNELEALRQRTSDREEEQEVSEAVDEKDEVDEEATTRESREAPFTEEEIMEMSRNKRAEEIRPVIREKQPVDFEGICNEILGYKPDWDKPAYKALHNAIQTFRDELVTEKDGRGSLYAFSEEAFEDSPEEEDTEDRERTEDSSESEDDVDEEEEETEGEGLFRSVSAFNRLGKEQREDEIKQVIREYEPIGTSGICEKLFGYEAKSGTDAYVTVQNTMQHFRDELETEEDGRGVEYRFPESDDQDSTVSSEPESETVNETEDSEIEEPGDPSTATEPEDLEPVEQISDDRKDFSKCEGRHTLQEIREKEDLDIEAQVLKAFQEYGLISIPEATQVLFGFEASEQDEEYQAVWNQLSDHKAKEGKRVEATEREGEETLYEVFGPFKLSNLYYSSLHKLICTTCAPEAEAVFESKKDAVNHKVETKNDEVVDKHDLFVSASIPSDWHKKQKTVEQVVNRECGDTQ